METPEWSMGVIEVNMGNLDYKHVIITLCIVQLLTLNEGRALRKRTVSEVQLMHDLGELKQVQERQQWLRMRLQGIHGGGGGGVAGPTRRRLLPEELPDLGAMTPEEIQTALDLLEQLLQSKPS
ncbi:Parathyroid hormone [Liparis tanakae]|uniref:Parathyroid hormone n=1 Tax=Liparis tanakae TaxID=230148 RepID=A0A4Z2EW19_9TELE|nr:Parathyroid hormone [Liparis tanakae]